MFLINLSRREKTLFYITVMLIVLSLAYHFSFKPLAGKWGLLNREIRDKEIELKKNIKYIQQEEEIRDVYQRYEEYIQKTGSDEEEIASLLNMVEKLASTSQIHIANIRPKPAEDHGYYEKYILETICEATMESYIEFIYNLQQSAQSVRVEKLKLVSQGSTNPLLKAHVTITKVLARRQVE